MTQPAKAQEPSMEEILASIRRIIADDDAAKSPANAAEPPPIAPMPSAQPPAAIVHPAVSPRSVAPPPSPGAAVQPPHPAPSPAPADSVSRVDEIDAMRNALAPAPVVVDEPVAD